jgi:uncharacterized protein (TIGR03435 family)
VTLYLDTSSLVKLYVAEPGSDNVRDLVADADVVATSAIAYVEIGADFSIGRHHAICYLYSMLRSLALIMAISVTSLAAQDAVPATFDVVSIKPNTSGSLARSIGPQPGGFGGLNVSARELIAYAYGISQNAAAVQIVDGPAWLDGERFDVDARLATRLAPAQYPPLLQRMLADRFRLQVHRETRTLPVFALVAARADRSAGPGMRANPIDCEARRAAARAAGGPPPLTGSGTTPPDRPVCALRIMPGAMRGAAVSMSMLATYLGGVAGRQVIDRTGIAGTFDIDLDWTPDASTLPDPTRPDSKPVDANGPSLFTALQEQLRLKLEADTAPLEVVVIDRLERPEAN